MVPWRALSAAIIPSEQTCEAPVSSTAALEHAVCAAGFGDRRRREAGDLRARDQLVLGQRPRHAMAWPVRGADRPGAPGRVLRAGRRVVRGPPRPARVARRPAWCSTATGRRSLPAARRELADADAAIVTSYCPDALRGDFAAAHAVTVPVRAFYDLDTPVTLARLAAGERVAYIGPRGLARLRPGPELHRRRRARRPAARAARRAPRGAALRQCRPGRAPAEVARPLPTGPTCPTSAPSPPTGRPRWRSCSWHRPGSAGPPLRPGRQRLPGRLPLDRQHLLRPAPAARRAPGVLQLEPPDA